MNIAALNCRRNVGHFDLKLPLTKALEAVRSRLVSNEEIVQMTSLDPLMASKCRLHTAL